MTPRMKGIGHGPNAAPGPPPAMLPGWRAACAVYRRAMIAKRREQGGLHRECVAAFLEAVPDADPEAASDQVVRAIYWASVEHNAWLYGRQ